MLTPPDDRTEPALPPALAAGWGLTAVSLQYRPVGFGSHHWEVTDATGGRWFVTVDELEVKRHARHEPLDIAFDRLHRALAAAGALRAHGHDFVVAPVPTRAGDPLARLGDRLAVALYPFVDGRSFDWGAFASPEHRRAVERLVAAVHTAPPAVRALAATDDFALPHRDELAAALDRPAHVADCGPYARRAARLLAEHADPVRRLLDRYDTLVALAGAEPDRMVLTHGEPHPGNTMLAPDGWRLIDWDTARVAPPERDLWSLDPGDGSTLDTYAATTGLTPRPAMLELYRIRWDLADIAVEVDRFRRPHRGGPDNDTSWEILRSTVAGVVARDPGGPGAGAAAGPESGGAD